MREGANVLACRQFQTRLPELISSGEDFAADLHLRQCERCRALLADLETIAEAARELFPVVEPPEHLWEHIECALWSEGGSREPEGAPD